MRNHEGTTETAQRPRSGRITLYHPNRNGNGAAVQLELRLNREGEKGYDCFFLEMARQQSASSTKDGHRTPAKFDWAKKVTVKLDFRDVCEMLTVLEGRRDQAGEGQRGIYHETGNTNTIIALKKGTETNGYLLALSKKTKDGEEVFRGHVQLSEAEAIGLRCLFQTGLFFMAFNSSLRWSGNRAPSAGSSGSPDAHDDYRG